ncbi:hypothetical protein BFP70_02250 [Thioclava sp. SK-1]|uniref:YIP1 family protein n=1 Tax=Thioclava sp. SK-1 TaxID=1889770 RepID=UPI0008240F19|nr:YIP1 family protein [Thioclava sp. SK-1]OCX67016.1 hypothetical protein BFP70_02250 [Thioclava sp. SK-1]
MAAVDDILQSYRAPRKVVRGFLARTRSEPRALSILLAALIVVFVAQWPRLSRQAFETDVPMAGPMMGTALALGATIPIFYLLAALAHVICKMFGGTGTFYRARIALFWALLASAPLALLQGLTAGFIGQGPQVTIVGCLTFAAFILIWLAGIRVAEFETGDA